MATTTAQLNAELVALIKTAPSVTDKAFSVFNTDDLETFAGHVGFPIAGVSYEGCTKVENAVQSTARPHKSVSNLRVHFMVIVGVNYKYAGNVDSKPTAMDLLDETRSIVLGYRSVNTRPWVFTGELPLETELEGVIMYGQMWETIISAIGNSPT